MFAQREFERHGRARSTTSVQSSESSRTSDATTARWYEPFETCVAPSQPAPGRAASARQPPVLDTSQKQSLDQRDPDVRLATRRRKENFTAALVPSVEAWAVAVSPAAQETPVIVEAVSLAASTSACSLEQHDREKARNCKNGRRMTGQRPRTRQGLVGAVTGDQKYRQPPRYRH